MARGPRRAGSQRTTPTQGCEAVSPPPASVAEVDDLRAQLVTQVEVNRLLIAAQQNLLAADNAAEKYRAVAQNYLDALQFAAPGHLGELAGEL